MIYSEIRQRVYDILMLPPSEVSRMGYEEKIPRIINECLLRIANSVTPNLREFNISLSANDFSSGNYRLNMPPDFISFALEQDAYLNNDYFVLSRFVGSNGLLLTGKENNRANSVFKYTIFYNAFYPKISGNQIKTVEFIPSKPWYKEVSKSIEEFNLSDNIGNLIPHFVVGQLLAQDDKVRSIAELNEFDIQLATLDVSRNERQREYHSSRGWY